MGTLSFRKMKSFICKIEKKNKKKKNSHRNKFTEIKKKILKLMAKFDFLYNTF